MKGICTLKFSLALIRRRQKKTVFTFFAFRDQTEIILTEKKFNTI